MAKGDHRQTRRAHGSTTGGYARPRFQVGFDDETRQAIQRLAQFSNRSFAAQVRVLVQAGLEAARRGR